uniref:Peroxiredoxin-5 n=1 Tax=Dendroctonus ponderosae TaxID=77166 RepID=A0AAR5P7W4_DENPD
MTSKVLSLLSRISSRKVDIVAPAFCRYFQTSGFQMTKKVIVFAVPGAFTPGCSKTHLPGYVAKAAELKQQGISDIICMSVNDLFVMAAWAKDQGTAGKIRLLADPSAALAKALDLTVDIAPLGGIRSKRYSMVVEDGKITSLQVEPDGTGLSCSLADKIKL